MIDAFLNDIHQVSMISAIMFMLITNAIFSFYWPQITAKLKLLYTYHAVQKVHEGEVPRLGGLVCYCGLMIYWLLGGDGLSMPFIKAILLSSIPLLLIGVKEDLKQNTSVAQRLLGMFMTVLLFFNLCPVTYPLIEFPIIGDFINQAPFLSLIFFYFCDIVGYKWK